MGRDYIMHHGVKGQHKGHRRWQNPDGSYTDAGFVHYYGHPRIRGQKEKDGKDDLDALHKERKSVVDAELSKDKEYQRLKELHKRGVKEEKGMPIDLLMLEREDEVTRSSGRVTDVEWKMKNAKQKRNMEKAKKFLEKFGVGEDNEPGPAGDLANLAYEKAFKRTDDDYGFEFLSENPWEDTSSPSTNEIMAASIKYISDIDDAVQNNDLKALQKAQSRWLKVCSKSITKPTYGTDDPGVADAMAYLTMYGQTKDSYNSAFEKIQSSGAKQGVFSKLAMQVGENMKKSMEFRKDPENQKKYGQGIIPGLVNLYKDSKQKKAENEARQKAYEEKRQKLRDHLDDAEDKKWRKMLSLMRDDPDIKDVYKKVLKTEWGEGLKETGKRASDGSYYFSPYDAYASFWSYAMEDASVHDDAYYKAVYKAFDLEKNDPTVKRLREKEESLWNELEALDAQHKGGKK